VYEVVDDLVAFVTELASPEHSQHSLDDMRYVFHPRSSFL